MLVFGPTHNKIGPRLDFGGCTRVSAINKCNRLPIMFWPGAVGPWGHSPSFQPQESVGME
jgi:hypothetical protein